MDNTLSRVAELRDEMDRMVAPLRAQIKQLISDGLKNAVSVFFEQYPQVQTIYWSQYIPTWNDGDECVFGISDIRFSPVDMEEIDSPYFGDEVEDEDKEDFSSYDSKVSPEMKTAMTDMGKFLISISEYLEETYGSNAFVKLSRTGDWHEEIEPPY